MASTVDLRGLLSELRAAGPVERVRLLTGSLSALRHLSPFDRKVLLRMAGFEGAETLVERLALGGSETADALQGVLGRLETDPGLLKQLAHALADPARRGDALDRVLAEVDRTLAAPEPPELPPVEPPPPPPPRPAGPAPAAEVTASAGEGEPSSEEAGAAGGEAEPAAAEEPASLEAEAAEEEPERPAPPAEASVAQAPAPREPAPEPEAPPAEAAELRPPQADEEPPAAPEVPPAAPPVAPPPADGQGAPFEAASRAVPSAHAALAELLALHRRLAAGERPGSPALAELLDRRLPYPWARRRALQAWFASGAPTDLRAALGLLDRLATPADRLWCLAALARGGDWNEEDWLRILAAAPTPASRRRLQLLRPGA